MKKILLLIVGVFAFITMQAQPSDAAVTKKIRERFPKGSIKLGGSSNSKEKIGIVWHYYYWRHFTVSITNEQGIKGIISSAVIYEKQGGNYTFHNYATITTEVEGLKDPDTKELVNYMEGHLEDVLGSTYNTIVGELPTINIPQGQKYVWKDPNHVIFFTDITYANKVSGTEIEKAKHSYEMEFFRDAMEKPWSRVLASEVEGDKKVIYKKAYTAAEIDAMKTLQDIDIENQNNAAIASLPKVAAPPVFKSDKQLFYYIHEKLMSSDVNKAKAYLYSVMSEKCYETGKLLKMRDQEWFDQVSNNISVYQKTHCLYPSVKEEQYGQIIFYDKEKRRSLRLVGSNEDGTWKLRTMTYYPASAEDAERMQGMQGNCEGKPDLAIKEVKKYEIGDVVDVTISNTIYTAKVVKKDANFSNRYFVKCINNDRSYWVNDDVMTPSTAKASTTQTHKMGSVSSAPKEEVSFKVGDKVAVRTRSGNMNGKIIKTSGSKHLVKLSDPRYQDMWVSPGNLIKR